MNDASQISDIIDYIESVLTPTMKQDTYQLTLSKVRSCYRRILYKILDSNEDPMKDGYTQFKLLSREQLKTLIDKIKLFDYHAMTSQDVSRFRSLNFLYLTFYLDSDSHYFKEKTLYSRIYALWYICRKGKDIKYLKSHLGKWASLPKLYGYNFNKIISIIKSSEEVQASFDNLDIDF
jgi:hypothetical protein